MYDIAMTVTACLRAGTDVQIGWVVDAGAPVDLGEEALALTPGGGSVGAALRGALDGELALLAHAGHTGRLHHLELADLEARAVGLPGPTQVDCLLLEATALPEELWPRMLEREPAVLLSRLDGDVVVETTLVAQDELSGPAADTARAGGRAVTGDLVVTSLRPFARLVIAGSGPIAEALAHAARPMGWRIETCRDTSTAIGQCATLSARDRLVVAGHDTDVVGAALATALQTPVGYIGAIGGARIQAERATWLADRGHEDLSRVHAPAGLDIGAEGPEQVAIAVLAEAIAALASPRDGSAFA